MTSPEAYVAAATADELMTVTAARQLQDGDVVFVGIGLPSLACNVALRTHAPRLCMIYESGAVGAVPDRLPLSIGDPALVTGALQVCAMSDVFQLLLQGGRIAVGFLGGAQIDRWGNINTTAIGDYAGPRTRLPGSGGAAEIAALARRTLIVSRLSPRAFPAEVDFITSPGHRMRGQSRAQLGIPGAGPLAVITDKGVLAPDPETGEMVLVSVYEGVRADDVRTLVGWPLRVADSVATLEAPTAHELEVLRALS